MADRLKRAWFARIAVGMAALAFPLLAVGSAQAAIAGANPEQTQSRPDLVSATALDGTHVDFCFDKVLNNSGFAPSDFALDGYRALNQTAPAQSLSALLEQTVDTTGKCVRVTFDSSIGDIGNYTNAHVNAGAVQTASLAVNLEPDSTPLTVPSSLSPTHNGTTGFTIGPDLVGILPDPTTNTIIFTFDQAIGTAAPLASAFQFVTPGGLAACSGIGDVVSGNEVIVAFPATPICQVANTTRGIVQADTVAAAADPAGFNVQEAAVAPGSNGVTSTPDLTGATLESNGQAIDFTFDKNVGVTTPGLFEADLSDGLVLDATSATVIATNGTSTTVRAVFQVGTESLSLANEYVVWGSVEPGAVTEASPPNNANLADAKPAGDNAGAFARGFTTGPDVFAATVSKSTGVVTIALDQRIFSAIGTGFFAVDNTGFPVAGSVAGSVGIPTQAAGPELITVAFSPGQVTTMTNLFVEGGSMQTAVGGEINVDQDLSVTSTASLLRAARSNHPTKKSVAAHRARVRREQRALRAQLLRHLHRTHH